MVRARDCRLYLLVSTGVRQSGYAWGAVARGRDLTSRCCDRTWRGAAALSVVGLRAANTGKIDVEVSLVARTMLMFERVPTIGPVLVAVR